MLGGLLLLHVHSLHLMLPALLALQLKLPERSPTICLAPCSTNQCCLECPLHWRCASIFLLNTVGCMHTGTRPTMVTNLTQQQECLWLWLTFGTDPTHPIPPIYPPTKPTKSCDSSTKESIYVKSKMSIVSGAYGTTHRVEFSCLTTMTCHDVHKWSCITFNQPTARESSEGQTRCPHSG
jgi:hypothetical protein